MNIYRECVRLFLFFGFTLLLFSCSRDIGQLTPGEVIDYSSEGVMTINGKDLHGDLAILPGVKIQRWSPWDNHSIRREEVEVIQELCKIADLLKWLTLPIQASAKRYIHRKSLQN